MSKTFKDHKEYKPYGRKPRHVKYGRGCNLHGVKGCEWCMENLLIQSERAQQFADDQLEDYSWEDDTDD